MLHNFRIIKLLKINAIVYMNGNFLYWGYWYPDSYSLASDTFYGLSSLCCQAFKISYLNDCSKFEVYMDPTNIILKAPF